MRVFTTGEGFSLRHLTDGYPWVSIPFGSVIDLGSSHKNAAFALARKYPNLRLIVQDLPEVVASSKKKDGVDVKFMAHNFFEEHPIKGDHVYYYRWALHNWPDKSRVKILKALVPTLKKGARVLIIDLVMLLLVSYQITLSER